MSTPEDVLRALTGVPAATRPHQFAGVFEATVTRVTPKGPKFTVTGMGQVELGPAKYLQPVSLAGFGAPAVGQKILVAFMGGDPNRPVAVGRITTWPAAGSGAQGAFAITFDDCHPEQNAILERMAAYGQHATVFANQDTLDHSMGYSNPGMMTLEQLARHQGQGHEIGNHSRDHLSMVALTPAVRASSLEEVEADFASVGIPRSTSFAYPFGFRSLSADRDLSAHGFRVFRYPGVSQFPRWDSAGVFRVGAIRLFSDSADPTGFGQGGCAIRDAKALARMAVASPVVISFFAHMGVDMRYPSGVEPTLAEIDDLLEYLAELGLPCLTYQEVFGGLNRLVNPSFEDAADNPDGWTVFYRFGDGTDSIETITPYPGGGGTRGLLLDAPTSADGAQRGQRVWVKPNRSYLLSGRARLTDGPPAPATYAQDDFARTVVDGFGSAPVGGAYTVGTGPAADLDVGGGVATIVASAANPNHYATLAAGHADIDERISFSYNHAPGDVGVNFDIRIVFRRQNISNYLYVVLQAATDGLGAINLNQVIANAHTQRGNTVQAGPDPAASTKFWGRVQVIGDVVRVKFWADDPNEGEPGGWQAVFEAPEGDPLPSPGTDAGFGVLVGGGITTSTTFSFDDFEITEPQGAAAVAGLRLEAFQLDSNGLSIGSMETTRLDLEEADWVQLAFDAPLVMLEETVAVEIRAALNELGGQGHIDNVVWGLAASQPDGPVG